GEPAGRRSRGDLLAPVDRGWGGGLLEPDQPGGRPGASGAPDGPAVGLPGAEEPVFHQFHAHTGGGEDPAAAALRRTSRRRVYRSASAGAGHRGGPHGDRG